MEGLLLGIVSIIVGLWLGSIEIRMRNVRDLLGSVPSKKEVTDEIMLRQESLKVLLNETREDIREIKRALEKLSST